MPRFAANLSMLYNEHAFVDRFAAAGFTALAPDLYHGESSTEPDGAGKLMMALNLDTAGKDLSGAVDLLISRSGSAKVGVVGFCMGGGLALVVACQRPDAVAAVAARGTAPSSAAAAVTASSTAPEPMSVSPR